MNCLNFFGGLIMGFTISSLAFILIDIFIPLKFVYVGLPFGILFYIFVRYVFH